MIWTAAFRTASGIRRAALALTWEQANRIVTESAKLGVEAYRIPNDLTEMHFPNGDVEKVEVGIDESLIRPEWPA